jgi:hypothetical protein
MIPAQAPSISSSVGFDGRHGEDSKGAAELVGLHNPRAAEIGCDLGRAVRAD